MKIFHHVHKTREDLSYMREWQLVKFGEFSLIHIIWEDDGKAPWAGFCISAFFLYSSLISLDFQCKAKTLSFNFFTF